MKKTILALSTALTMGSALAATSAATTTSTTSISSNTFKKILEKTSASYYGAFTKDNQGLESDATGFYHEITASYNYGSGSVFIRPRFSSVDGADSATHWRNPRMGIKPWSMTSGKFSTANEIRLEVAMDGTGADTSDTDTMYGTLRYSQAFNYQVTTALTGTAWVGLYKNLTKDAASQGAKDSDLVIIDLALSYSFNDKHSISTNYEFDSFVNENALRGGPEDFYSNKVSNNIYYLRYTNSAIKNTSVSPGIYISGNELENLETDNIGVSLELSARI